MPEHGAEWTAADVHVPSADEPPPAPPPPRRRGLAGARRPPVLLAGAFAVLAALVGVVAVATGGSPLAGTTRATAGGRPGSGLAVTTLGPAPTSAPASTAGPGGLSGGVLAQADLGGAWTPAETAGVMPAATLTGVGCGSTLWAHDVAGYQSTFKESTGAAVEGEVASEVFEAPSTEVADQQRDYVGSAAFALCLQGQWAAAVKSLVPAGQRPQILGSAADPFDVQTAVPTIANAVTISVGVADGSQLNVTVDVVVLFNGPYMARLTVLWCNCATQSQSVVSYTASLMANRLQALPPDGVGKTA